MEPRQIVIRSKDFHPELLAELKYLGATILNSTPSMLWIAQDKIEPSWADCVWRDVRGLRIESITDGRKKLKAISKSWRYHGDLFHRRGALIADPFLKKQHETLAFPVTIPDSAVPVFTMAATDLIYYSHEVQRPTVDGQIAFLENKTQPPSRAYLKLWEALTILGEWPKRGEQVVDLGSSPGSWSWALAQLQAQILSIDRSELAPAVMKSRNVEFKRGDAFSFQPTPMDWVFSDVICFPEKLYTYVQTWIQSGHCQKFVCNVKFTGDVDPKMVDRFRKIPHSRVLHLLNGKKEVTWICHPKIP
ncbi:SAM-dependent methyltransferase [Bdellovibrionota bacterium FG-2]